MMWLKVGVVGTQQNYHEAEFTLRWLSGQNHKRPLISECISTVNRQIQNAKGDYVKLPGRVWVFVERGFTLLLNSSENAILMRTVTCT